MMQTPALSVPLLLGETSMSFGEAVAAGLRGYFDFQGRAGRSEFWWFMLFVSLVQLLFLAVLAFVLYVSASATGRPSEFVEHILGLATIVAGVGTTIPFYSAGARRLHDIGRSGWWWLIGPVPLGIILLIYWWCQPTAWDYRA